MNLTLVVSLNCWPRLACSGVYRQQLMIMVAGLTSWQLVAIKTVLSFELLIQDCETALSRLNCVVHFRSRRQVSCTGHDRLPVSQNIYARALSRAWYVLADDDSHVVYRRSDPRDWIRLWCIPLRHRGHQSYTFLPTCHTFIAYNQDNSSYNFSFNVAKQYKSRGCNSSHINTVETIIGTNNNYHTMFCISNHSKLNCMTTTTSLQNHRWCISKYGQWCACSDYVQLDVLTSTAAIRKSLYL